MNILKEIIPGKTEKKELKNEVDKFLKKLKKTKDVKFVVGGSYAKNTWLSGNDDVDIFAKFNYKKYKDKDISKELKKILSKNYTFTTVHGSRDYFHIKGKDIIFEIVPVLDIKKPEEAINVTDVSPLHTKYIKKHTNKKLQNEIRILKKFCKANQLYGAESYIKGFSGYVLEILIIHYKSFDKLMKNIKKWEDKTILDPGKFYKSKDKILNELNPSKKESPLILIDPVQPDRNAAAALGKKVFDNLVSLARLYDGSELFFKNQEVNLKDLKGYIILEATPLKGKKDIVGAKLLKTLEKIKRHLEFKDFEISDYGWKWNETAYFWFKTKKLSKTKKHYGPSLNQKKHIEPFKKRWKGYKIKQEKGRLVVTLEREFTDPKDYIKKLITEKEIIKGTKNIKLLRKVI